MLDLIIKNALLIDGSGAPPQKGDLGVKNGFLVLAGSPGREEAKETLEAGGAAVCPGFIDMHSHADLTLAHYPEAPSLVHQGVTTAVTGQCGDSPAPLFAETREEVAAAMALGENTIPADRWTTWAEHLDYFRRTGLALNMVPLVGQGTVRAGIMGFRSGPASPRELERMREEVALALEGGAWGLSTGLIYPPGSYASTEEIAALTEPVGERGGFYFSHIRGEGETLLQALEEALEIGRRTGAKVRISHLKAAWPPNWDKMEEALGLLERAAGEGLSVMADAYPYTAGATWLKSVLPEWAQEGRREETFARLADPAQREKIRREMDGGGLVEGGDWSQVMITRAPGRPDYTARTVSELAREEGRDPLGWVFGALIECGLETTMVVFMSAEENVRKVLKHPLVAVGSDSSVLPGEMPPGGGSTHPRTFGTFPRILGRYVREEKLLGLEEAVHKMTGLAARSLGLTDRGLIRDGMRADLVVFDPDRIADRADYADPYNYPEGIEAVYCNGTPTLKGGRQTRNRPGMVLERT